MLLADTQLRRTASGAIARKRQRSTTRVAAQLTVDSLSNRNRPPHPIYP
jgi:hypothetical protein